MLDRQQPLTHLLAIDRLDAFQDCRDEFEAVLNTRALQAGLFLLEGNRQDFEKSVDTDTALEIVSRVKVVGASRIVFTGGDHGADAGIRVTVSLDESLRDKVSPGDTVFIFARAVSGPPMPLAAVKQPVSALPLTVTLTDAMAMMPEMKLSLFDQVTVAAKISSTGTAGPAAGDLFGEVSPVDVSGNRAVRLIIDQVR